MKAPAAAVLLSLILFVACGESDESSVEPATSPSATPTVTPRANFVRSNPRPTRPQNKGPLALDNPK